MKEEEFLHPHLYTLTLASAWIHLWTVSYLFVSEGEFALPVLQSPVVHPLLHQVTLGGS